MCIVVLNVLNIAQIYNMLDLNTMNGLLDITELLRESLSIITVQAQCLKYES